MSYDDLRDYLRRLRDQRDPLGVRVDWSVVDPELVEAIDHNQRAGLQVADAVASSFFYAVNVNRFGETENRYVELLWSTCYRHRDIVLGNGVKFWPEDISVLSKELPQLEMFGKK